MILATTASRFRSGPIPYQLSRELRQVSPRPPLVCHSSILFLVVKVDLRNRATVAAEALLDGQAEALTRKAIERALDGDILALRLCLDRILPARTGRRRLVRA